MTDFEREGGVGGGGGGGGRTGPRHADAITRSEEDLGKQYNAIQHARYRGTSLIRKRPPPLDRRRSLGMVLL